MKSFIIDASALKEAVRKLGQAVSSKAPIPIIQNLHVKKDGELVVFTATDLELTVIYACKCDGSEDFTFLLPFFDLKRIVDVELDMPLKVSLSGKNEITITGADDEFHLGVSEDVGDFPAIPKLPKKNSIELNGTLIENLNTAMLTVGKDELRPALSRVLLDLKRTKLIVVGTDAYNLYAKTNDLTSEFTEQFQISPKVAKALDGFVKTTLSFNADNVAFHSDPITVITKRFEDKYANYKAVIPEVAFNGSCNRDDLQIALEKCCVIQSNEMAVVLTLGKDKFDLEAMSPDTGKSARTMISGTYEGECGNIALNAKKLLVLLSQIPKDIKQIRLQFNSSSKAVLVGPDGDDSLLLLIMPITLNANAQS